MANFPSISINPPVGNPVSIIGPQYCSHNHPITLAITDGKDGNEFAIQDSNGNILFNMKGVAFSVIHQRRILYDAAGTPIVTIQRKMKSAHDRWQVFRGDSKESSDLIFSVKRSSMFQLKLKLDVILANNTKEDFCDFKLKGGWLERSFTVYAGESSTAVAQINKTHTGHAFSRKDTTTVVVNPNIDYAFIIALILTLDPIIEQNSMGKLAVNLGTGVSGIGL